MPLFDTLGIGCLCVSLWRHFPCTFLCGLILRRYGSFALKVLIFVVVVLLVPTSVISDFFRFSMVRIRRLVLRRPTIHFISRRLAFSPAGIVPSCAVIRYGLTWLAVATSSSAAVAFVILAHSTCTLSRSWMAKCRTSVTTAFPHLASSLWSLRTSTDRGPSCFSA